MHQAVARDEPLIEISHTITLKGSHAIGTHDPPRQGFGARSGESVPMHGKSSQSCRAAHNRCGSEIRAPNPKYEASREGPKANPEMIATTNSRTRSTITLHLSSFTGHKTRVAAYICIILSLCRKLRNLFPPPWLGLASPEKRK
ncbi:hypothetical protein CPSG_04388 [Coccidioides posadasii str. Silveira]|uniref:Uncharacterized protein n=1 Tax=Coccidioides posadasii (strain RMSCC 757 / Silveira) TaxID=443226 RepID=E9D449_COCPS|nr:hypothetical protein CPSG_04388 [Coccidioides posadasii str. Silveira]